MNKLTDLLAEADMLEANYYVGSYFGDTLNLIPVGELMNLDVNESDVLDVEKDGNDVYVIISNADYRSLLGRI